MKNLIRESLYFSFANRKSTDYNIVNVSVSDGGLFEEQVISNKSINEISVRGNDTPYFINVKNEPKTIQLSFAFLDTWNEDLIEEVLQWLNVGFYEPLSFGGDLDRVYYAMPVDGINLIHNGLKQGYLTLNMRCNSPYSYSHEQITPWIECKNVNGGTFISPYQWIEAGVPDGTIIEFYNLGHYNLYPEIWIKKNKDGDVTINNLTNKNKEFKFTNLKDQEEIYIDCENEIIETSLENVYRYDDFNDNYLELVYGKNLLKVAGNVNLKFRYRYVYS